MPLGGGIQSLSVRPQSDSPTAGNPRHKPNVFVLREYASVGGLPRVTNSEVDLIWTHKDGLLLLINRFCPSVPNQVVEEIIWQLPGLFPNETL